MVIKGPVRRGLMKANEEALCGGAFEIGLGALCGGALNSFPTMRQDRGAA
jgi:hypothetical protein